MRYLLLTLLMIVTAVGAEAASGIRGRAAWRGELVPGIKVRAYREVADIDAAREVAVSEPAGLDGTYVLDLPPGSYYLTARDFEGSPRPGNHFCYYSGAPVRVQEGGYATVGFNLIRIPEETPAVSSSATGIRGEITFRDDLLERVYLYVYKDPSKGFKGPAYYVLPVEKGTFRLRLPPGEYYLLARKREKGGQFGPIEPGDYFNYYYGNPLRVTSGEIREVKIETITRLSMLEEGYKPSFHGIRGTVLAAEGTSAKGLYVFAYDDQAMSGAPAFFTPVSDNGAFELPLPGEGPYYLLAREVFGGPASQGERYGKFSDDGGTPIPLKPGEKTREVTIRVQIKVQ